MQESRYRRQAWRRPVGFFGQFNQFIRDVNMKLQSINLICLPHYTLYLAMNTNTIIKYLILANVVCNSIIL